MQLPGTGLVAFGALGFDPASTALPFLVVPQTITGVHGGRAWVTTIRHESDPEPPQPTSVPHGPHWSATLGPGSLDPDGYQHAVRSGIEAITAGEASGTSRPEPPLSASRSTPTPNPNPKSTPKSSRT